MMQKQSTLSFQNPEFSVVTLSEVSNDVVITSTGV